MAKLANASRGVLPSAIPDADDPIVYFRALPQRELNALLQRKEGDTDEDVTLRIMQEIVCDDEGNRFEDITDDPSCLEALPMDVIMAIPGELSRVFTPDPKS